MRITAKYIERRKGNAGEAGNRQRFVSLMMSHISFKRIVPTDEDSRFSIGQ